jgi:UDP-N-acetyl-2-amino-2-deoxyglucuronate dehydrogenase
LAGYIAPRHLKAIKETGNELIAAMDASDSVGVIDSYFPKADFFSEYERFDRHLEKIRRAGTKLHYLTVCSPNYLHDAHIRFGLRHGADVICEKPLVLNPWNVDALKEIEKETGKKVYNILQLRVHPSILDVRNRYKDKGGDTKVEVDLTYITSRGNWYYTSWKGNASLSGGIATNIGIHFFDMLQWIFGPVQDNIVHVHTHDRAAGKLVLERANVKWFLSINADTLPAEVKAKGQRTYRNISFADEQVEFSGGFTDLHTKSYEQILAGGGYGLDDAYPSIDIVHNIRSMQPVGLRGDHHPFAELPLAPHPFDKSRSKLNK